MAFSYHFKPTHKEIKRYYEDLADYAAHEVEHEGAVSSAFENLLRNTCKKADWHLVPQLATRIRGKTVRPDGTLRDDFNLHRGYWEAKDSPDKPDVEIRKKIALGYPRYSRFHGEICADGFLGKTQIGILDKGILKLIIEAAATCR
ncbi:MAG: hypothetical protein L0228_15640 [Planctomycetes bacterium]|nr:hypothetical protein [Planctomycetota bacterium]